MFGASSSKNWHLGAEFYAFVRVLIGSFDGGDIICEVPVLAPGTYLRISARRR